MKFEYEGLINNTTQREQSSSEEVGMQKMIKHHYMQFIPQNKDTLVSYG